MSLIREQVATFTKSILMGFLDDHVESDIGWDTPIGKDGLGVESIGILEVVVHLEREYDISVPDESIEKMPSFTFGVLVDEFVALIPATAESEKGVR